MLFLLWFYIFILSWYMLLSLVQLMLSIDIVISVTEDSQALRNPLVNIPCNFCQFFIINPANIYLFKVNSRNTRKKRLNLYRIWMPRSQRWAIFGGTASLTQCFNHYICKVSTRRSLRVL